MANQKNIQLEKLKTIREMQESMQTDSQQETIQNTLRMQVEETQRILEQTTQTDTATQNTPQDFPDWTKAKTIKQSMADWIDDANSQNISAQTVSKMSNIIPQPQTDNNEQNIQPTPLVQKTLETITTHNKQSAIPQSQTSHDNINKETQEVLNYVSDKKFESDIAELKQEKYQQIVKSQANTKQETWLLLDEFLRLSGLEKEKVQELINNKTIKSKQENNRIYIEASTGTSALIKKVENRLVSLDMSGNALDPVFVEKTIATILGLHDKVISSKDETIAAFKSENSFLKEALVSMQEIYDDDKKTIEILRQQLQKTQEEVEFVKRKYKLMWGRVSNSTT